MADDAATEERRPKPGLALAVLSLGAISYALLQSLVVPALPVLERDLHTSTPGVTWLFTVFLLSTSVATPLAGRFGDMFGKKRMLLLTIGAVMVGSLCAALAHSLPFMIAARAVQGLGGAIVPLCFGIIRDEFPRERVAGAIGVLAGLLGVGGGLGIVLAGPILESLSYHWLFWIPLITSSFAAILTVVAIPESPIRAGGDVHWTGAALLSGWLICFLLGVSEGPTWGWSNPGTLGLFAAAAILVSLWIAAEAGAPHPLVDMRMMRRRAVWTTNTAALLLGFGMYGSFLLIPEFVQTPASTGYGFGATVTQAGFFLIPMPAAVLTFSLVGGRLAGTRGSKAPFVAGTLLAVVSFTFLTVAHSRHFEVYVAAGLMGIGIGLSIAAMTYLIVDDVRRDQTGIATGMNTIFRTIGGAIGAQVAASVLASHVARGEPRESGFTITFALCAIVLLVGLAAAFAVPDPRRRVARSLAGAEAGE